MRVHVRMHGGLARDASLDDGDYIDILPLLAGG